jgi:DNA-binding FrmR family transcriptional regulator
MQDVAKNAVLRRLNRIAGQVRGLVRIVDEDRYCIEVVTQVAAVRTAPRKVEEGVLRDHVAHCIDHAVASGDAKDQRRKVAELIEVLGRTAR